MTRKIKCAVRCEYWNSPEYFEIEVHEDATQDEIYGMIREAAYEIASVDYWIVEDFE